MKTTWWKSEKQKLAESDEFLAGLKVIEDWGRDQSPEIVLNANVFWIMGRLMRDLERDGVDFNPRTATAEQCCQRALQTNRNSTLTD